MTLGVNNLSNFHFPGNSVIFYVSQNKSKLNDTKI